jgi:hypothetical protein
MPRNRSNRSTLTPVGLALGAALFLAMPMAARAQSTSADGTQTYALTPEQKAKLLAVDASLRRAEDGGAGDGHIHGEVGMMVGTRNTHGIYGNAVIPLGHGATAAISFENYQTDPGKFRWHRNQWYYAPDPNAP